MTSLIPMSPERLHKLIVLPYEEGAARLDRAWLGINIQSLNREPLYWIEKSGAGRAKLGLRTISLITGILLSFLPLVNTVIWIAWKTFGRPENLSDPFTLN
jgi:hypothetical protein